MKKSLDDPSCWFTRPCQPVSTFNESTRGLVTNVSPKPLRRFTNYTMSLVVAVYINLKQETQGERWVNWASSTPNCESLPICQMATFCVVTIFSLSIDRWSSRFSIVHDYSTIDGRGQSSSGRKRTTDKVGFCRFAVETMFYNQSERVVWRFVDSRNDTFAFK